MRHARPDYDRIQDPAVQNPELLAPGCSPIGEDEPVFLLRARDVLAPEIVWEWANRYGEAGGNPRTVDRVVEFSEEMMRWQEKNGSKMADYPGDEAPTE